MRPDFAVKALKPGAEHIYLSRYQQWESGQLTREARKDDRFHRGAAMGAQGPDMTVSSIKGVAEIVINVRDLSAMTNFYREVLRFTFHSQFPDTEPTLVFLTVADLDSPLGRGGHPQLFALLDPRRYAFTRDGHVDLDNQRSSLNHLAFEIDSADFTSEKQRLEGMGLAVRVFDFPNMRAKGMFFNDPEGNTIELICHSNQPS